GFIFWGLAAYVEGSAVATIVWFSLAALAKETAILAPLALAGWEIIGLLAHKSSLRKLWANREEIPQGLKPASAQGGDRSAEALRHPKSVTIAPPTVREYTGGAEESLSETAER